MRREKRERQIEREKKRDKHIRREKERVREKDKHIVQRPTPRVGKGIGAVFPVHGFFLYKFPSNCPVLEKMCSCTGFLWENPCMNSFFVIEKL